METFSITMTAGDYSCNRCRNLFGIFRWGIRMVYYWRENANSQRKGMARKRETNGTEKLCAFELEKILLENEAKKNAEAESAKIEADKLRLVAEAVKARMEHVRLKRKIKLKKKRENIDRRWKKRIRCFTRYTGFRWRSRSPINWLYWLTRCRPQPLQRISVSWYRPMHNLGLCALPMLVVPPTHTELAHCLSILT